MHPRASYLHLALFCVCVAVVGCEPKPTPGPPSIEYILNVNGSAPTPEEVVVDLDEFARGAGYSRGTAYPYMPKAIAPASRSLYMWMYMAHSGTQKWELLNLSLRHAEAEGKEYTVSFDDTGDLHRQANQKTARDYQAHFAAKFPTATITATMPAPPTPPASR